MTASFLRWWLLLFITIASAITIHNFGLFGALWEVDFTKISFIIIALYIGLTLYIGFLTIQYGSKYNIISDNEVQIRLDNCWFTTSAMIDLGMVGTIVGFIIMMGPAFQNLDLSDTTTATQVLSDLALGMSTALTTTLTGLICSLMSKVQLMNFEHGSRQV